jgi:type IV pilus assembly protein PilX
MQNKMASNEYDRQIAFQSAESALRQGRTWLTADGSNLSLVHDCTQMDDPCFSNPFIDDELDSSKVQTVTTDNYQASAVATGQPQYVVEKIARGGGGTGTGCDSANAKQRNSDFNGACLDTVESATYYRITARSGDPSHVGDRAIVTLQSVIRVQ